MPDLLTPDQLAERWSVPKSYIYKLSHEQRIRVVKLGKYLRLPLDAVLEFEQAGERPMREDD